MTIEINWWMLSPLAAICLTALAYQLAGGYARGWDYIRYLLMLLTFIFTARFLP